MTVAYNGSIGAVSCHFVKGNPPAYQDEVVDWRVPGINGVGYLLTGKGGEVGSVDAIQFGTAIELAVWYNSLITLKSYGIPVTITNDAGMVFLKCLILHLSPMQTMPARLPGETFTMRAQVQITVRRTGS